MGLGGWLKKNVGKVVGGATLGLPGLIAGYAYDALSGGGGGDPQQVPLPAPPQTDMFDAPAIAARQRAARRMADGFEQTKHTSTRGLEALPGTGLKPPPGADDYGPIISTVSEAKIRPALDAAAAASSAAAASAAAQADEERRRREEQLLILAAQQSQNRQLAGLSKS
jgi:hypothetical protein